MRTAAAVPISPLYELLDPLELRICDKTGASFASRSSSESAVRCQKASTDKNGRNKGTQAPVLSQERRLRNAIDEAHKDVVTEGPLYILPQGLNRFQVF